MGTKLFIEKRLVGLTILLFVCCLTFPSELCAENQQEIFELGQQLSSVDSRLEYIDSEIERLRALLRNAKKEETGGDQGVASTSGQNSDGWNSGTQSEFDKRNMKNPNQPSAAEERAYWEAFNARNAARKQQAQQASQEMWGIANDMMGSMNQYWQRDAQRRAAAAQRKLQQNQANKVLTNPYQGYQKRWSDIEKHNAEKARQEQARKAAASTASKTGSQSTSGGWGQMPSSSPSQVPTQKPKEPTHTIANPYGKYEKAYGTNDTWGEIEKKQKE